MSWPRLSRCKREQLIGSKLNSGRTTTTKSIETHFIVRRYVYMHFAHYYSKHLYGRKAMVYRGGFISRAYHCISTNQRFVGAVPKPALQIDFQRQLVSPAASTKIICRGGCNTSDPNNSHLQGRFTLQYIFTPKKLKFQNSNVTATCKHKYIYIIYNSQGHYINS